MPSYEVCFLLGRLKPIKQVSESKTACALSVEAVVFKPTGETEVVARIEQDQESTGVLYYEVELDVNTAEKERLYTQLMSQGWRVFSEPEILVRVFDPRDNHFTVTPMLLRLNDFIERNVIGFSNGVAIRNALLELEAKVRGEAEVRPRQPLRLVADLKDLAMLKQSGYLSEEEFEVAKRNLLGL